MLYSSTVFTFLYPLERRTVTSGLSRLGWTGCIQARYAPRREERNEETSSLLDLSLISALAVNPIPLREATVYFNRSVYRELLFVSNPSSSSFFLHTPARRLHTQFLDSFSFPFCARNRDLRTRSITMVSRPRIRVQAELDVHYYYLTRVSSLFLVRT